MHFDSVTIFYKDNLGFSIVSESEVFSELAPGDSEGMSGESSSLEDPDGNTFLLLA